MSLQLLTKAYFFTANAFNCYQCSSTKNWDDFEANEERIACPPGFKCGKVHVEAKVGDIPVAMYAKGCTISPICNNDSCRSFFTDSSANISKCEVNCCIGDLCNEVKEQTSGYGLKCYQCLSSAGWDDCDSNRKEILCATGATGCSTTYVEGKLKGNVSVSRYAKGCSTIKVCKGRCRAFIRDPEIKITKCKMNCCKGDFCNEKKKVSPGYLVKCLFCSSKKSWEDCASVMQETTCPIGIEHCVTASIVDKSKNISVTGYVKGCGHESVCTAEFGKSDFCKNNKCMIKCCKHNLRNGVD